MTGKLVKPNKPSMHEYQDLRISAEHVTVQPVCNYLTSVLCLQADFLYQLYLFLTNSWMKMNNCRIEPNNGNFLCGLSVHHRNH